MSSNIPLDYASFQLSPKRSRCELFVSGGGNTEKIAEEQVALSITHQVNEWFTKGTLERFARFDTTPEVLQLVTTYDAEMSHLEAALQIYGSSDQLSPGGCRSSSETGAADATKKELLRAIDVRLETVKQNLATACARSQAAGFNHDTVAHLQLFSERFGAIRLNQACCKYISLYNRWPGLFKYPSTATSQPPESLSTSATVPAEDSISVNEKLKEEADNRPSSTQPTYCRQLSVQDRINLFENKQKEGSSASVPKSELRRLPSDISLSHSAPSAPLKRWSGSSDITIPSSDHKEDHTTSSTGQLTTSSPVKSEDSVGSNQQLTSYLEKTRSSLTSVTKSDDDDSMTASQVICFHGANERIGNSDAGMKKENNSGMMTLRDPSYKTTPSYGSKIQEAFAASQQRGLEVGSLRSQPRLKPDEVQKKDSTSTDEQYVESGPQRLKFQEQVQMDDNEYVYGYSSTPPSGKLFQGESGSRHLKGNQVLNDELKLKANELEKLFAEHKLRVLRDQSKTSDAESDQITILTYKKQAADPVHVPEQKITFESPVLAVEANVGNHNHLLEVAFSEDNRGKLYDSYMKKRDARLRELWNSNRAETEAMHDSVERHSTEMKAKLTAWYADRHDSVSSARRRAERLRSFSAHSTLKREEPLDFGQLPSDGDLSGFGVSRKTQSKKLLPRTPVAVIPRSATKLASTSGRLQPQPDKNPLAQSVPNFSDLRKENTRPYSTASKATARSQLSNYTLNRSTKEEMPSVKEDKSRRSQPLRKSSLSSLESSEGVVFTQSKIVEPKRFLRKNTGIGPSAGSVIAKMKASMVSKVLNDEEEYDKTTSEPELVKDDGEEELDTTETEDQAVVDEVESQMSPESKTLMNSESENGNTSQSFSQVDDTSIIELPAVQDSPSESPISWNSPADYPFSYTLEASDVESPVRTPASWNLQPTEADAALMRKKWGITQKATLSPSSPGLQYRKDMAKGFKRFLKFGRKSRYTENLADYISATTSEGDDDTEDGRNPANWSSEDLGKSRMGYSRGSSESDFYIDQVHILQSSIPAPPANFQLREDLLSGSSVKAPRSFFSLSSFRSKGSMSKPR